MQTGKPAKLALAAGALVLVILAAAGGFVLWLDADRIEQFARERLPEGVTLELDSLERSIGWTLGITATGVDVAHETGDDSHRLLAADKISAEIEWLPLLSGNLRLQSLQAAGADLALRDQGPFGGSGTEADASTSGSNWQDRLPERFTFEDVSLRRIANGEEEWSARAESLSGQLPDGRLDRLRLEDGSLEARRAGEAMEADIGRLVLDNGQAGDGTRLVASGRFDGKAFDLELSEGGTPDDAADESAAAGGGDGGSAHVRWGDWERTLRGQLGFDLSPLRAELALESADHPERFEATIARIANGWSASELLVRTGERQVRGDLELLTERDVPLVRGDIEASGLSWPLPFLEDDPDDGDIGVALERFGERLDGVDLDLDVALNDVTLYGVSVADAELPLRSEGRQLVADGYDIQLLDGKVVGEFRYEDEASGAAVKLNARIQRIRAAELLDAAGMPRGPVVAGVAGKVDIEGDAANPQELPGALSGSFTLLVDGGKLASSLAQLMDADILPIFLEAAEADETTPIRCGIVAMEAEGGVFQSETILVDTGTVKLVGEGSVDVGAEQLDLLIVPHGKDFSVLSATAPVEIKGSFEDPVAEVARGRALGALLTPVELGLTDNADCEALLEDGEELFASRD